MKVDVGSYIEFGKNADTSRVYFTIKAENPTEEALLRSLYGLKGRRVVTCTKSIEVSFNRKVEKS